MQLSVSPLADKTPIAVDNCILNRVYLPDADSSFFQFLMMPPKLRSFILRLITSKLRSVGAV